MAKGTIKIRGGAGSMGSIALINPDGSTTSTTVGDNIAFDASSIALNVGDMVSFDIQAASAGSTVGSSVPTPPTPEMATNIVVLAPATVYSGPLSENIRVKAGECVVINNAAVVDGNIRVNGGTLIITDGVNMLGNIKGSNGAFVTIDGRSTVDGNVKFVDTDATVLLKIDNSTIGGNVRAKNVSRICVTNSNVEGNVVSDTNPLVTITGNTIGGNLRVKVATTCKVSGNTVEGKTNAVGCV